MCKSPDKRPVKIAKPEKRAYVLYSSGYRPILDSCDFYGVHACHPLFNDYPQVINAGGVECAF
jgi:hypothetical protein